MIDGNNKETREVKQRPSPGHSRSISMRAYNASDKSNENRKENIL